MAIVGIVTHPFSNNYGGILQAWALQQSLINKGYNVVFLRKKRNNKVLLKRKFIKAFYPIFYHFKSLRPRIIGYISEQCFSHFCHKYLDKVVYVEDMLNCIEKRPDILITGSDQVWRKWGQGWDIMFYFLNFAADWNVKRYAYAASFGIDEWEFDKNETDFIKSLLKNYCAISVREQSGVSLCKDYLGLDAQWVLDPTLLLSKNDYVQLQEGYVEESHQLVSYILDPNSIKEEIIYSLGDIWNCKSFAINHYRKGSSHSIMSDRPPISYWLAGISNAEFLVTDSFHGVAFAINFNTPFFVISNQLRGQTRISSILKLFNLEDRLVNSVQEALHTSTQTIDWSNVNNILSKERLKAFQFLSNL